MLVIFVIIGILISIIIFCVSNNLKLRSQLLKNMNVEQKNQQIIRILNEKDPSIMEQMYQGQGGEGILSQEDIRSKIEMRSPVMNILGILRKQFIPHTIIEEKNEEIQEEQKERGEEEEEQQEEVNKDKEI